MLLTNAIKEKHSKPRKFPKILVKSRALDGDLTRKLEFVFH